MRDSFGILQVRWMIFSALGCAALTGCGGEVAGGSGGGSGETLGTARTCDAPTSLGGNWERCADGTIHRSAPGTCESSLPTPDKAPTGEGDQCTTDAECTERPNGFCAVSSGEFSSSSNYCAYGCLTDADCSGNYVCLCGAPVGECVPATCTSDADCGEGLRCADYNARPACGDTAFACETAQDTCVTDADCANDGTGGTGGYDYCSYGDGRHQCERMGCYSGRPFLVAGAERLAGLVPRSSWSDRELDGELALGVDGVRAPTASDLARIAAAWRRVGLMEHASIAAFARFTLQLLSVGAPAELVVESGRALADETRHARLCFSLAHRFDGQAIGPGPLAMDGALDGSDLRSLLTTTVLEGCVGETVAAVEAAEAAQLAVDPEVRQVLEGIAEDEARHAALAWKFVQWALDGSSAALREDVERLFARVVSEGSAPAPFERRGDELQGSERVLIEYGHLPESERVLLRSRVLQGVVAPAARALLSTHRAHAIGELAPVLAVLA